MLKTENKRKHSKSACSTCYLIFVVAVVGAATVNFTTVTWYTSSFSSYVASLIGIPENEQTEVQMNDMHLFLFFFLYKIFSSIIFRFLLFSSKFFRENSKKI